MPPWRTLSTALCISILLHLAIRRAPDARCPAYQPQLLSYRSGPAFLSQPLRQPPIIAWRHRRFLDMTMVDGDIATKGLEDRRALVSEVRKAARLGLDPGRETLRALSQAMQRSLLLTTGSPIDEPNGPGLYIRVVRDLATLNHDPGRGFWVALAAYLLSLPAGDGSSELLSMGHVGSLATSVAVLGVPEGSEDLVAWLLSKALASYPWDRSVAEQLDKAAKLLEAAAGRAALLSLVAQLREKLQEMPPAPPARETSVLSSDLHLRIVDSLVNLGLACQAEVSYMGFNLDVVVWPVAAHGGLRPLVLEVDGPQHFLDRDPSRPTGPTLSRRRLLSASSSPFQGVVPLVWLDFTSQSSSAALLDVVERRVAEEHDGLSLALYRHLGLPSPAAQESWELAKGFASATEAELVALLEGQEVDGAHLAVLAQRLYTAMRRQQEELSAGCRSLVLERLVCGVRETSAVLPMRVHCLGLVLRCLAYCRHEARGLESIQGAVFQRLVGEEGMMDQPPSWAVPTILEAMSMLGWRLGCSTTAPSDWVSSSTPAHWRQLVLAALRRAGDMEASELVQLIASLGALGASRLLVTEDERQEPAVTARLQEAFQILQGKVSVLRPHQLVELVRGILQLGVTISQSLEDAILKQAGAMAPSFSLDALAVVMIREPAIGDGETSLRARRKAVQSRLGSEIRWRLRAMNPPALLKSMERLLERQKDEGFTSVSRGFLVMWASEVFKRRSSFSREQRARVMRVVSEVQAVWDPGEGWRVKFLR